MEEDARENSHDQGPAVKHKVGFLVEGAKESEEKGKKIATTNRLAAV